jgi:hypothetical protein
MFFLYFATADARGRALQPRPAFFLSRVAGEVQLSNADVLQDPGVSQWNDAKGEITMELFYNEVPYS